jgi:23S rRNA G2069 N7-methylase RlmK/C1962 C5-methylase RlmI
VVVVDPPSFAPNKAAVPRAQDSYERLFAMAAKVTSRCACGVALCAGGLQAVC